MIALGGGALSNPFVSDKLKKDLGFKLWIDVDDKTAFERIKCGGLPPFLSSSTDPEAKFAEMNRKRREVFSGCADAKVAGNDTPDRIALQILSLYKEFFAF